MIKEKNYITPMGLKVMQDEYDHLTKVERPEMTKTVAWAASNGDRSENADYLYGKKRLREIDRRLRFLSKRIEVAVVVDPEKQKSDKVQFGATVTIVDEDTGDEKTVKIIGVDEIDTHKNKISWKSPLGSVLLGKEEGDTVKLRLPVGEKEFEITEIKYQRID